MLKRFLSLLKDSEFSAKYDSIMEKMSFSKEKDIISRDRLHEIISMTDYSIDSKLLRLENSIKKSGNILIFGGGPDSLHFLELSKMAITESELKNKFLIVAIDGSTELLSNYNIIPDIIFSDLDGFALKTVIDQKFENSIFIIHAHGDNLDKINEFASFLTRSKYIIGTTQNNTNLPIINHGGFTDGDRCLYLISNFLSNNQIIYLVGYDFGNIVGKHSKMKYNSDIEANTIKMKKLKIGSDLTYEICLLWPCKANMIEVKHNVIPKFKNSEAKSAFNIIKIRNQGEFEHFFN